MPETPATTLQIGFDVTRTQAALHTVPEFKTALAAMLARFPTGRMTDLMSAAVPIDGFVAGIGALASWPHPEGLRWEDSFATLIRELLDNADAAEQILAGETGADTVASGDVPELLGPSWRGGLTAFQKRDAARLLSLGHGANFSVPGAGKTRVALAVFAALRDRGTVSRMLVVSPKSAYEAWSGEAEECFDPPLALKILDKGPAGPSDVLVVNYERIDRSVAALSTWLQAAPSMIVLDEAHRMKLGGAGVYGKACLALGPLCRARLILTGTPAPNGAKDLENLLSFVWPGHGRRVVTQAVDGGNLAHASRVLRPLYTRTTKHELGLPPTATRIRWVQMPPLHRKIYDALAPAVSAHAAANRTNLRELGNLGKSVLRLIMAATSPALLVEGSTQYEPLSFQVPALHPPEGSTLAALLRSLPEYEVPPKYAEAALIATANAAEGRKTLVWASFVRSISTLETMLAHLRPAVVHGGTPDREEQIRRFREDPECAVLISNPATLGEGISLHQVCHDAVYVDRDFQAGRFLQSLDRIHRLGLAPDAETRITVLATAGTVDEVVADRLAKKLEFMGRVLDDPSVRQLSDPDEEPPILGGLDAADVQAILTHAAHTSANAAVLDH